MGGITSVIGDAFAIGFADPSVGEDAIYTPAKGDPVECHVIKDERGQYNPPGFDIQVFSQVMTIRALLSELGQIPATGDTFTIGLTTYRVKAPPEYDGVTVKAVVE
jgi:hypothetical protein